jgi:serine/threonine protein kinase
MSILLHLLNVLKFLHENRLPHGDIKLQNIVLTKSQDSQQIIIKLLDLLPNKQIQIINVNILFALVNY